MKKMSIGVILSYLIIYIVWGSTYLGIKWAVETIPPFYVVGFRFLAGGIIFLAISFISGKIKSFPKRNEILSAVFLGTFLILLGNGLITWAEKKVDSYLAALIVSSAPFCIAFFNWVFFREKLSRVRLSGMFMGVLGVGLILYNGNSSISFSFHLGLVFAGFVFWGFATSMGHRLQVHSNNLLNSGIQMFYAGIVALVISMFMYKPFLQIIPEISFLSWMGFAYLTILGAVGFYAYNYLLSNEPAIRISSYAIVNPLIAVLLGIFLGKEETTPALFIGMPIILAGLAFMMYGETLLAFFRNDRRDKAVDNDEAFDEKITDNL
jgi:drug/metabolite transporter (DMT)-like permease